MTMLGSVLGPARARARHGARRLVDAVAGPRLGSIPRVRTAEPLLALTFDDGPDPERTPRMLDVLAAGSARATFFMLLERARRHPAVVRRVVAQGHEVALHGIDHACLAGRPRRAVAALLGPAAAELAAIADAPVALFRPTYGAQSVASYLGARSAGLECVVWNVDGLDWCGEDVHEVSSAVLAAACPGAIVLLHDGLAGLTATARPGFDRVGNTALLLDGLDRRGLRSTTVSHLLTRGSAHRTAWFHRPPPAS